MVFNEFVWQFLVVLRFRVFRVYGFSSSGFRRFLRFSVCRV